ncbi:MAG: DUF1254 domain-containing protein [Betaproteobacteria bacterium]|nr:DUF1254 domain-containing protein [Betaproteobacteria bacterium]MDH5349469.1 DUF1254 domain-containing protein [Betaproteobacteria bacterium]
MKITPAQVSGTLGALLFLATATFAAAPPQMKMTTDIPKAITTPDSVETRIGTLKFFDGFPDDATTQKVYDNLDFMRGVEAFLNAMPGASAEAIRVGWASQGAVNNQTLLIMERLMDSKSLFLTPNTESVYHMAWLDTSKGPLVLETPPNVLGIVDDHWFKYVGDFGNAGPDKGKGGKFLLLPPGYKGEVPKGYVVMRSPTYGNLMFYRGFLDNGSTKTSLDNTKNFFKVYSLSDAKNPPPMKFINVSGKEFNTIHANDFHFYEEVNAIVQYEPNEALNPETLGLLAAIGIEKDKNFAPDARMKKILTEAAAVASATSRALTFRPRIDGVYYYPDRKWFTSFAGGSYEFLKQPGVRNLDGRVLFHYYATGITPAMAMKIVGVGSQYAAATTDSEGKPLDGSKTYKIHLPPNIPAKNFWSIVVYDNQTRSMLQTDHQFPSISSQRKGVVINADSSVDVWFGPTAPKGHESNWVQTVPGKGWNVLLRLYGPLQPWFDKTWKPGDFELVK